MFNHLKSKVLNRTDVPDKFLSGYKLISIEFVGQFIVLNRITYVIMYLKSIICGSPKDVLIKDLIIASQGVCFNITINFNC